MPNYSLVINSKFKPFSYQELLQPALMSTQAHQEVEDAYAELATKANVWDKMTEQGSKAHNIYETYAKDLADQAEQLSKYGLTPMSRQSMLNMKSRYSKDIVPIEQAYNRRKEHIKQQSDILAKDPTHVFARMASTTSLDDYITNPSLDVVAQGYSGNLLEHQVSQAAAALAKNAREDRNVQTRLRKLLPYQYETIRSNGFKPEEVYNAIIRSEGASSELINIVDNAINGIGMDSWGLTEESKQGILNQLMPYANRGLWSAVGTTQYGQVTDQAGLSVLNHNLAIEGERQKAIIRAAQTDEDLAKAIGLRGTSYIVSTGKDKEYLDAISGLKAGKEGVSANVFGKHGKVNALKVYEEYQEAINKEDRKYTAKATTFNYPIGSGSYGLTGEAMSNSAPSNIMAKRMAGNKVLKKYGVSRVLTREQYEALKGIGYNGETVTKFTDLTSKLNALSQYKTYFSTNMGNYNHVDGIIRSALGNWNVNDSFEGRVYLLNADGKQGKSVSYKDLDLYNSSTNKDGKKVTDISYDVNHPNQLIIQIGDSGDRYLVDPNVLGTEVAGFLKDASSRIDKGNESLASHSITVSLAKILNDFNQVKPESSSKALD